MIVGCKVCGKVHAVDPNHPQLPRVAVVRMCGIYGSAPGAHRYARITTVNKLIKLIKKIKDNDQ